jgi:hypothetical protein
VFTRSGRQETKLCHCELLYQRMQLVPMATNPDSYTIQVGTHRNAIPRLKPYTHLAIHLCPCSHMGGGLCNYLVCVTCLFLLRSVYSTLLFVVGASDGG